MELADLRGDIDMARRQRRWADAVRHASIALQKLSEAELLGPGSLDYSLAPFHLDHLEELASFHLEMGDVAAAKSYGEKALAKVSHLRGADSSRAQELRRFLEE